MANGKRLTETIVTLSARCRGGGTESIGTRNKRSGSEGIWVQSRGDAGVIGCFRMV